MSQGRYLDFTTRILGKHAAAMLKSMNVFQSIRSARTHPIRAGETYTIALDGEPLYKVIITSVQPCNLGTLIGRDALDGGFEEIEDLQRALRRAGYRFQPLTEYNAQRVRFSWARTYKRARRKTWQQRY